MYYLVSGGTDYFLMEVEYRGWSGCSFSQLKKWCVICNSSSYDILGSQVIPWRSWVLKWVTRDVGRVSSLMVVEFREECGYTFPVEGLPLPLSFHYLRGVSKVAEFSLGGGWRMLGLITPMFKVGTFKVEVVVSKLEFLIGGGGGN